VTKLRAEGEAVGADWENKWRVVVARHSGRDGLGTRARMAFGWWATWAARWHGLLQWPGCTVQWSSPFINPTDFPILQLFSK
jgi:hypothetical protein